MWRTQPADIVLLDAHLPGMDGWAVCESIKKGTQPRPVIMLTAFASDDARARSIRAGADQYVTKPFRTEALLALMEHLLNLPRLRRCDGPRHRLLGHRLGPCRAQRRRATREHGRVLMVTKRGPGDNATAKAQGGFASVMDASDSIEAHVSDTEIAAPACVTQRRYARSSATALGQCGA